MKSALIDNNLEAETEGNFEHKQFGLKLNASAFAALSSGIYANKIRAVIRELSTNAYDSHVQAGTKEPFKVHLPTRYDPEFRVRDYGTALDHQEIMEMYTTYFQSTKTNTNDAIGCFGLGSKCPFAYTDSFTVVSYYNGVKRTYSLCKQHEMPVVAILKDEFDNPIEENTDEPNGLEVIIPVDAYDCYNFQSEAEEVYRYFKQSPKIEGVHYTTVKHQEYNATYEVPPIFPSQAKLTMGYCPALDGMHVVMGGVAYPIKLPSGAVASDVEHIAKLPIVVYLNIGDVQVSISREALSYTEYTCNNLDNLFRNLAMFAKGEIERKFKDCKHTWEAVIALNRLYGDERVLTDIVRNSSFSPQFNGQPVKRTFVLKHDQMNITVFNRDCYKQTKIERRTRETNVQPNTNIKIVINDVKTGFNERCRQNLSDKTKIIYLLNVDAVTPIYTPQQVRDNLIKELDCDSSQIVFASSLTYNPAQVIRSNTHGGFGRNNLLFYNAVGQRKLYLFWKKCTDDLNNGCYYIPVKNNQIMRPTGGLMSPWDFAEVLKVLEKMGINVDKVYGIKYYKMSKVKGDPRFINVLELVEKKIQMYAKDKAFIEGISVIENVNKERVPPWMQSKLRLTNDCPYKQFQDLIVKYDAAYALYYNMWNAIGQVYYLKSQVVYDLTNKVLEHKNKCLSKYPLLNHLNTYGTINPKPIVDYVNLIEKESTNV